MRIWKRITDIIVLAFLTFTALLLSVFLYIRFLWPNAAYEQILMTVRDITPRVMSENAGFKDYFFALLFFIIIYPLGYIFLATRGRFILGAIMGLITLYCSGYFSYHYYRQTTSTLYEEQYIFPDNLVTFFPQKKRNLVLIYLESFEQNFSSAVHYEKNLIPNLTSLQDEGQFSLAHNTFPGTDYSIAAFVASHCGIPLRYTSKRDIWSTQYFLPQAVCFPELLQKEGYQTALVKASDITFTDVHIFAQTHGYNTAEGADEILKTYPASEKKTHLGTFGGVNDKTLFDFAKEKLALFDKDKPFMLTLFSLDTHMPTSYHNPKCLREFNDMRDVFMCTDKTVYNFISWLKNSPYWENTTVVILGDHLLPLRMNANGRPRRGIYNVFLNLPDNLQIDRHKEFSTFDLAPTILESLGITLQPQAFGLGRSLFAKEKTLIEADNSKQFYTRLLQNSKIYNTFTLPKTDRENIYTSYTLGTVLTKDDFLPFTDAYKIVLNNIYLDRLNLQLNDSAPVTLHAEARLNVLLNYNSKLIISANGQEVFVFTPTPNAHPPFQISFDIPEKLLGKENKLQLLFSNNHGLGTALQMGINPVSLVITKK